MVKIKAQASGCIPVTTRIGALNETVHPEAPSSPNIYTDSDVLLYKEKLLATLRRIRDSQPEDIKQEREKYIAFAKSFSWTACVDKWISLYESVKK